METLFIFSFFKKDLLLTGLIFILGLIISFNQFNVSSHAYSYYDSSYDSSFYDDYFYGSDNYNYTGYCGDGTVQMGEECDDGNNTSDDGCNSNCINEYCGDGTVQMGEECDDGNNNSDDGCNSDCINEYCGDGTVQMGEECDDGNNNSDDGCNSDCINEYCGDGTVQMGEECDDGNNNSDDGCNSDCINEYCGDGTVQMGEECDDGNNTSDDGCNSDCINEYCGDGTVQMGEECDDGNTNSDDGCNSDCINEYCGDGTVQMGEECDDGNTNSDDGCNSDCINEYCGDGTVQMGEECDDGNNNSDDGCSADCQVETNPTPEFTPPPDEASTPEPTPDFTPTPEETTTPSNCRKHQEVCFNNNECCKDLHCDLIYNRCATPTPTCNPRCRAPQECCFKETGNYCDDSCATPTPTIGSTPTPTPTSTPTPEPTCGNGNRDPGENCDDGNDSNNDPCLNDCMFNVCGDGYHNNKYPDDPFFYEECDDGNYDNGDGCSSKCLNEICGNGRVEKGTEECDDGNTESGDGCNSSCEDEYCGDGYTQESLNEECDDGNDNDDDECDKYCRKIECGNGRIEGNEKCDDGNNNDNDECNNSCQKTYCGDGVVQSPNARGNEEECDDGTYEGSTRSCDGCSYNCKIEKCGNGKKECFEECDDGNKIDGDGCNDYCKKEPKKSCLLRNEACEEHEDCCSEGCWDPWHKGGQKYCSCSFAGERCTKDSHCCYEGLEGVLECDEEREICVVASDDCHECTAPDGPNILCCDRSKTVYCPITHKEKKCINWKPHCCNEDGDCIEGVAKCQENPTPTPTPTPKDCHEYCKSHDSGKYTYGFDALERSYSSKKYCYSKILSKEGDPPEYGQCKDDDEKDTRTTVVREVGNKNAVLEGDCCCAQDNDSCEVKCQEAGKGYKSGYKGYNCSSIHAPRDCTSFGSVSGCCCTPCDDDDYDCLCKYGNESQAVCAAKKYVAKHNLSKQPHGVPEPTINYSAYTYSNGKSVCGTNRCPGFGTWGGINIAVCKGYPTCGDIVTSLEHELRHWRYCYTNSGHGHIEGTCRAHADHVQIQYGVYQGCTRDGPGDCGWERNKLHWYCLDYCQSCCPENATVAQLCARGVPDGDNCDKLCTEKYPYWYSGGRSNKFICTNGAENSCSKSEHYERINGVHCCCKGK